jgi:hypothetical protein
VPFLVTKIFVWHIVFPFLWCTFNRVQEIVVFDSTLPYILNVSNFVTADLYLQRMNIKSGGVYERTHLEADLHASWAGHSDVQMYGFVGGTGNWSECEQGPEGRTAGGGAAGTQEGMLWLPEVTPKQV